jgi:hypothetical protein
MSPRPCGSTHGYWGTGPIRTPYANGAAVTPFLALEQKRSEFGSYAATMAAGAGRRNRFELSRKFPQNI